MAPYAAMEDATIVGDESIMKPDDRVYSAQDVAIHNKPADCWLIIRGMVYDVTSWLDSLVLIFLLNICFYSKI
jgi:cytochrome b involved in lipid metabolism